MSTDLGRPKPGMPRAIAPGKPGKPPYWFSSRKEAVGAACGPHRRVWFTVGEGILDEIYYPRVDNPCTRHLEFLVADGDGFVSGERDDTDREVEWLREGVPIFTVRNAHRRGRYAIEKEIAADPRHPVVLQRTRFAGGGLRLHALLAPHLDNEREPNDAWTGEYKGMPMLFARAGGDCLALASTASWAGRSVGYAGESGGREDLGRHGRMMWRYAEAPQGNVVLTGEVASPHEPFVLAVGFGGTPEEAAFHVRASLRRGFDAARDEAAAQWDAWQRTVSLPGAARDAAVIHCHEDGGTVCPGGIIASLSIPWGCEVTGRDAGGYHLVWPRDACQAAAGLLAAGAKAEAERVLRYFAVTQEAEGHWFQRMWVDGASSHWPKLQLDAVAAPVLLFDLLRREGCDAAAHWPAIRAAAAFIARHGPLTEQDRWERNAGFTPFTLAVAVAALAIAGEAAAGQGEPSLGRYLLETADAWNARIESWIYASDPGFYCRIVPATEEGRPDFDAAYPVANHLTHPLAHPREVTSPDALALVLFGLRPADDPRIAATLRAIDATLRTETPRGPIWRRYNGDGYGEPPDGTSYRKKGIGRGWPLLTGERAHFELVAGRIDEARRLERALAAFGDRTGLLPEQIWDAPDLPDRDLFLGRPTGSARPLVWAHAERLKLLRSLRDGKAFAMPEGVRRRYAVDKHPARHTPWRFGLRTERLLPGTALRVELHAPALVRWSDDGWATVLETETADSGIGLHVADLPPRQGAREIAFTFRWTATGRWEGRDFRVAATGPETSFGNSPDGATVKDAGRP